VERVKKYFLPESVRMDFLSQLRNESFSFETCFSPKKTLFWFMADFI
jgi:hypothetical protein